jgi:hypothetical protein
MQNGVSKISLFTKEQGNEMYWTGHKFRTILILALSADDSEC